MDISQGKASQGNLKICLTIFFHNYKIKVRILYSLQLLKRLMVAIEKKPFPSDHESSLKNFICKLSLATCPCS